MAYNVTNSSKHFKLEFCLTSRNFHLRDMVLMCVLGILMCNIYDVFLRKLFNIIFFLCAENQMKNLGMQQILT